MLSKAKAGIKTKIKNLFINPFNGSGMPIANIIKKGEKADSEVNNISNFPKSKTLKKKVKNMDQPS